MDWELYVTIISGTATANHLPSKEKLGITTNGKLDEPKSSGSITEISLKSSLNFIG
jgi:hypothetical protein